MKLQEAIEILEDYHERLPRGVNDDYLDAIKLGIEALKRLEGNRTLHFMPSLNPLPGETLEEEEVETPVKEND